MIDRQPLEVINGQTLTDADWAEVNWLRDTYDGGGPHALSAALRQLAGTNPHTYLAVMAAFFPEIMHRAMEEALAEEGLIENDVREMIRQMEASARH
jgi:hypothetical protein